MLVSSSSVVASSSQGTSTLAKLAIEIVARLGYDLLVMEKGAKLSVFFITATCSDTHRQVHPKCLGKVP